MIQPGIVRNTSNLSHPGLRQEDHKFEESVDNLARCCLKEIKRDRGVVQCETVDSFPRTGKKKSK